MTAFTPLNRRSFLKTAAAGLSAATVLGRAGRALEAEPINFATWSAGVDAVKSHIAAFEAKTGVKVNYSNSPWAQYRETMITRFIGKAPIDTLWVSDSWLPEWADAGWIAPVDQYKTLVDNSDVDQFCVDSMTYKGKQYGNTYYSDYTPTCWTRLASKRRPPLGRRSSTKPRSSRTKASRSGQC